MQQHADDADVSAEDVARAKVIAEDLYFEMCSPPDDDDEDNTQTKAWIERVNEMIRTRLDFVALAQLIGVSEKFSDSMKKSHMALKRHTENHAMKADVFNWLDNNMSGHKSMDSAAEAIAEKIAPIAFRTARAWTGEWKKLRSAGTP